MFDVGEGHTVSQGEQRAWTFVFYTTAAGANVVQEEIRSTLGAGPPRKELGALLTRIQHDTQLRGDTGFLGKGLWEARLDYQGNAYRLYFYKQGDQAVLLGLHFHMKGGRGAQDRAIERARDRLADYRRRI